MSQRQTGSKGTVLVRIVRCPTCAGAIQRDYDGIHNKSTRRVLCCRYLGGREASHTLPRGAGATARRSTSGPDASSSEGTGVPDVLAGGTTSRSCRRTPRVSPLVLFGATLCSAGPTTRPRIAACPTRCARQAHSRVRLPRRAALRTSCRVPSLPQHACRVSSTRPWRRKGALLPARAICRQPVQVSLGCFDVV